MPFTLVHIIYVTYTSSSGIALLPTTDSDLIADTPADFPLSTPRRSSSCTYGRFLVGDITSHQSNASASQYMTIAQLCILPLGDIVVHSHRRGGGGSSGLLHADDTRYGLYRFGLGGDLLRSICIVHFLM